MISEATRTPGGNVQQVRTAETSCLMCPSAAYGLTSLSSLPLVRLSRSSSLLALSSRASSRAVPPLPHELVGAGRQTSTAFGLGMDPNRLCGRSRDALEATSHPAARNDSLLTARAPRHESLPARGCKAQHAACMHRPRNVHAPCTSAFRDAAKYQAYTYNTCDTCSTLNGCEP